MEVEVTLRFGHRWLTLRDILNLASGAVVELEESVAEPVEVLVGDRVLARGEIVSVDGCYGVRILETSEPHPGKTATESLAAGALPSTPLAPAGHRELQLKPFSARTDKKSAAASAFSASAQLPERADGKTSCTAI